MPPETDIAQHLVPIQNLLLYEVQNKHHENKILGAKWRKWSDRIPNWHSKFPALMRPPLEKLKKDTIMGLVTKTGHIHVPQT
jgi:hypothetical protein